MRGRVYISFYVDVTFWFKPSLLLSTNEVWCKLNIFGPPATQKSREIKKRTKNVHQRPNGYKATAVQKYLKWYFIW
jgi:hypothetical protein